MPAIRRRQPDNAGGKSEGSAGLSDSRDGLQPEPRPAHPGRTALDGPLPVDDVCLPSSSPPKKKLDLPATARQAGFAVHPELRWKPGRPTHKNFRVMPKLPGWRPYHPLAKFSADDVLAIRASNEPNERLAQPYGVGPGTIKGVRSGHRARILRRKVIPLDGRYSVG